MELTIEIAMKWILSRSHFGSRPGLERVEALLQRIDNPEKKIPMIHIAGTNGKGSTVAFLRSMFLAQGLKVGTFISPFVINYNEQISINGNYITDEAIIKYVKKYTKIVELMDQDPAVAGITEFETVTVIAFDYFHDENVDIAIVEVGMGGLLDSTNVIRPILTAITSIGKDHTDFLGQTIVEIAFHKAGIIKENVPVVTGNVEEAALAVIKEVATTKYSRLYCYNKEFRIEYLHPDIDCGEYFNFYGSIGELANARISLLGQHQCENAAVAIQLFILYCERQEIVLSLENLYQGLSNTKWPARMEKVSAAPYIILDGTHNGHAVHRLAENLRNKFNGRTIHILFSALSTKDFDFMIKTLQSVPNTYMYLTTFDNPRAVEIFQMENYKNECVTIVPLWRDGLKSIIKNMPANDLLLVTGSLYFVSQVRRYLQV